jgi:hypothetical protein
MSMHLINGLIQSKQAWIEGERRVYLQGGGPMAAAAMQRAALNIPMSQMAALQNAAEFPVQGVLNAWANRPESNLVRARRIAAEVRARKPEMQVRRLTNDNKDK